MVPCIRCDFAHTVRRVLEQVVLTILFSVGDSFYLRMYGDYRLAKTVEFVFRFALRWLDHHGPADWPRDRRCVEAVIHQSFCRVFYLDTCALPLAQIDDALVRHEAVPPF